MGIEPVINHLYTQLLGSSILVVSIVVVLSIDSTVLLIASNTGTVLLIATEFLQMVLVCICLPYYSYGTSSSGTPVAQHSNGLTW